MSVGDLDQDDMVQRSGARVAKSNRKSRAICVSCTGCSAILKVESEGPPGGFVSAAIACPRGILWWKPEC